MVWQPVNQSDCGTWPAPPMELIAPMWVASGEPGCESVAVEPLVVESTVIEAGDECCCLPVVACCESNPADQTIEPVDGIAGGEWDAVAGSGSVVSETMVADELLGDVVAPGESVDGLTVMGEGEVVDAAPAEILPTLREEEVREIEPLRDLAPAGEAGSSVLVEEGGSRDAVAAPEPSAEPVVHEPLQMDAPTVEPVEPEVPTEPVVAPEQAPPETEPEPEPEPVNIFEAEEGDGAAAEPNRRWIHARGDRSLVARLVSMPDAETCLLETAGRRIRVPLQSLSQHDRVYAQRTCERLAAARAAAESRDTAGL